MAGLRTRLSLLPLRTRLALSYVVFFAAALIALDIGLFLLVRWALISSIDSELGLSAQLLQQNFSESNESLQTFYSSRRLFPPPTVNDFSETKLYVTVYRSSDQSVVAQSTNFPDFLQPQITIDPQTFQQALQSSSSVRTVAVGPMHVREWLTPLRFRDQIVGVLQVSRLMKETDQALRLLSYALFGGGVIVVLAAARGGMWLTSAALKPIEEVTQTAQGIVKAEDLGSRVPVPETQDELHHLTVTINDLLARLEALFSAQRRFVADVSHELRTPLAAMQGNLDVLARGVARDPALLDESITDMRREVSRLIRMVNDLLLLAQSDAGNPIRHEPVELDTLVLEVHRDLRGLSNGVLLKIGEEDQVTVDGDRDRLKQALLNLGINAIQHTPPGGSVTLNLRAENGMAQLSVTDTGAGIAPDDLPHIFDRFYRADRARTSRSGGAGLGLAIVKWIAEAHGGRVQVESAPGRGSTFTLVLPLPAAETQPVLNARQREPSVAHLQ
ncbi:MAG TPA: ATP-binding protein [Roseiflexaceae bacterium]|nr:ATP-binding protein [Roseiflexaceae bacterium]